jgi:exopolyphosphatase/guanosine-5'-triphosphate,3'-diphosphate pyrophosphatase
VRRRSLDALAARFVGWSEDRAARREAFADTLYAALERPGSPEMRDALRHGARILDIGRAVDFFDRHEHAADLALATDLAGLSHRELALLAAVVARAGDEQEDLGRSLAPLVTAEDEEPLERAAVLLVLADEITERTPPGSGGALECRLSGGRAVVSVRRLPSWNERRLPERFAAAFGRELEVRRGGR